MQQVVRGGALDTVLLEMSAVPEDRLTQYLSLATGLPAASKNETDVFDENAIKSCPREIGDRFRVAPLHLSDSNLKVIVCEPVDRAALQRLADEIGMSLQPLVVPEYRFHVIFSRVYDSEANERYEHLAQRQQGVTFAATGGAETVILESSTGYEDDRVVVDTPLEPSASDPVAVAQETPPEAVSASGSMQSHAEPDDDGAVVAELDAKTTQKYEQQPEPAPASDEVQAADQPSVPRGTEPISVDEARAAIRTSNDRDEIFELLLRGLRSMTRYAALLTIQKKQAVGRRSIHDGSFTNDITSLKIPLKTSSAYKNAVASGAPFVGPMQSGSDKIDALTGQLGGQQPGSALIVPVKLRGRVVALAVAHSGDDGAWVGNASTAFILGIEAAEAVERLLLNKSGASSARDASSDAGAGRKPHGKRKRSKTNAEDAAR